MFFNEDNLQLPEMVLTDDIYNNLIKYMNVLMDEVYKVILQNNVNYEGILAICTRQKDW